MATILVVEDNTDLLAIMEQVLGAEHRVVTATSGVHAIELARSERPSLAILDVNMPGMDGIETGIRIKEMLGADISILMLSAMAELAEGRAAASGICDLYLSKPATLDDIRNAVDELLGAQTGTQ
jgi:CheY-like chemotaxis protein